MPVFYCCLLYLVATLAVLRTMIVLGFYPSLHDTGECIAFVILGALWPVSVPVAILVWSVVMLLESAAPCATWLVGLLSQDEGNRT